MNFQLLFLPVIRHFLTTAGGSLATHGILQSSDVSAGVGALMTLLGITMSAINASKKKGK